MVDEHIDKLASASISISELVEDLVIRDWKKNLDVMRKMQGAIDNFLLENSKNLGLELNYEELDEILLRSLKVAKHNF